MKSDCCGATFECYNGHVTSPCELPKGHEGDCRGWILGSPTNWPQGVATEEELNRTPKLTPEQQKILDDNPGVNITFEPRDVKLTPEQEKLVRHPKWEEVPGDIILVTQQLIDWAIRYALRDLMREKE